jgi:hypothetical protein
MISITKTNILTFITYVIMISHVISLFFLTTYFFHLGAYPAGTIDQYIIPYMVFNVLLSVELAILIGSIVLSQFFFSDFCSTPAIAKVLFGENANRVINLIKSGSNTRADNKLILKICGYYVLFPTLYLLLLLIINHTTQLSGTTLLAEVQLSILFYFIGHVAFSFLNFNKKSQNRWLAWISILSLIFIVGIFIILPLSLLYLFYENSSTHLYFHPHTLVLVKLFCALIPISSLGLIKSHSIKIPLRYFRIITAAAAIFCILISFQLFYSFTALNLQFIGKDHISLTNFHPLASQKETADQ